MKTFQQFQLDSQQLDEGIGAVAKVAKFLLKPSAQAVGVAIDALIPDPVADGTLKGAENTARNIEYRDRKQQRFQDLRQSGEFTRSRAKKRSDSEKEFQNYLKNR